MAISNIAPFYTNDFSPSEVVVDQLAANFRVISSTLIPEHVQSFEQFPETAVPATPESARSLDLKGRLGHYSSSIL